MISRPSIRRSSMLVVLVVVAVIVLLLLYVVFAYNGLVRLRNRIDGAWAQIDVQLRRRYDLIPNLVETVKGYAAHEREVFEDVARARAQGEAATTVPDQAQAENELTRGLRRLIAVAENYPQLKASVNFLALQEELTATESKIAYARQFYNDQVAALNTYIQSFPSAIVARLGDFAPRHFFDIEDPVRG